MMRRETISPRPDRSRRGRCRSGIALAIVVTVMAVAAVLGYAMLSGSAVQAVASANAINNAIADAQAESGIHLAMYYLLNPTHAPGYSTASGWYWTGASNITFATSATPAASMPGSVTVTVSSAGTNLYNVTAVGSSGVSSAGGGAVTRTITATVQTLLGFSIQQAVGMNSTLNYSTLMDFTGSPYAVESTGTVTLVGGTIHGNVAATVVNVGGVITGTTSAAPTIAPTPALAAVTDYRTYTYQGVSYSATQLTTTIASNTSLGPTVSNPLGVYWINASASPGYATIGSNVTISGTLLVKNGPLSLAGSGDTITAQSGMPALVIDTQLEAKATNESLTVNGLLYAGGGITETGLAFGSTITVNGAFLSNTGTVSGYLGNFNVTYNSSYTSVPTFSTSGPQAVYAVKIQTWSD
jgi:Tfp pilus assembly protein PilX